MIAATGTFAAWATGAVLLGAGTAMVYPTLLAAIGESPTPNGGHDPSASTGSGATAASPSARSSPESSPTSSRSPEPCTPSLRSPPHPACSSPAGCTKPNPPGRPHRQHGAHIHVRTGRRAPNSLSETCCSLRGDRLGYVQERPRNAARRSEAVAESAISTIGPNGASGSAPRN